MLGKSLFGQAQELVGYLLEDSLYDCRTGGDGVFCGEVRRGHGSVHDRHGSTLVELEATGACRGQTKVYLGAFEECSRKEISVVALYIVFIDPDFVDENFEDEPEREVMPIPDSGFCNVYDKEGRFRSAIAADGTVLNCFGDEIGVIDMDRNRAKGKLCAALVGTQVCGGKFGLVILKISDCGHGRRDLGRSGPRTRLGVQLKWKFCSCAGRVWTCKRIHSGFFRSFFFLLLALFMLDQVYLGEFRGCSFAELDIIALYVLAIDSDFVNENQ